MGRFCLPIDLIYEILIKIPVKPLHRLRCVSRQWYALISDPSFQKDHDERSLQQSPLLLVTKHDTRTQLLGLSIYNHEGAFLEQFSLPFPKIDGYKTQGQPIQSCRGLVCLWKFLKPYVLVCNPSTKERIALPTRGELEFLHCECVGFGYAESIDDFKVVRFISRQTDYDKKLSCEVFTLGSGDGWREARSAPAYWPQWNPPFLNRALHLMPGDNYLADDHYIAVFDIDSEEYRRIPLPEVYFKKAKMDSYIVELRELEVSLCLIFNFVETEHKLELWYLNDYPSGKWVMKNNINVSLDVLEFLGVPSAVMANGSILVRTDKELLCYNPQQNYFAEPIGSSSAATLYTESFFALRGDSIP